MADLSALAAVENANLVFQKADIALKSLGAKSEVFDALRAVKAYMSQIKRNPDLRFSVFSAADVATANDGHGVGLGTARIYFVFLKKKATATDAFASVVDNGTDDNYYGGSLTGSVRIQAALLEASDQFFAALPQGLPIANGIRVVSTTAAAAGTTANAAADGPDGFIISGAA
jgi:hypothetical protein